MDLEKIDIKKFKKDIYLEYKKLFPAIERKPYRELKRAYDNSTCDMTAIIEETEIIGFFITNSLKSSRYLQLDYFAIFPKYQNKGYGTKAVKLLKEMYKNYDGIFIEVESIEHAKTDKEREIRKRRAKFYENLGFCKLDFELELFNVIYSAYMLPCKKEKFICEEVIEEIFKIYTEIVGKNRVNKKCKVIKKSTK